MGSLSPMLLLLSLGVIIASVIARPESERNVFGCEKVDHEMCNDVCREDGYWFGHCALWNGRDLRCTCIQQKKEKSGVGVEAEEEPQGKGQQQQQTNL